MQQIKAACSLQLKKTANLEKNYRTLLFDPFICCV